eukprot:153595-Chlamydomonas_euryale.AAC.7
MATSAPRPETSFTPAQPRAGGGGVVNTATMQPSFPPASRLLRPAARAVGAKRSAWYPLQ